MITKEVLKELTRKSGQEFVDARAFGKETVFLIRESFGGGTLWTVNTLQFDLTDEVSLTTFLENAELMGESETFGDFETAMEDFKLV